MSEARRSVVIALFAIGSAALISVPVAKADDLNALMMGGTGMPTPSTEWMDSIVSEYIDPATGDIREQLARCLGTRGAEVVADATGVPDAVPAFTCTTSVKVAVAPGASVAMVAVAGLLPLGLVSVQPAGPLNDTNVVPAGRASVSVTAPAGSGPALVTVMV